MEHARDGEDKGEERRAKDARQWGEVVVARVGERSDRRNGNGSVAAPSRLLK